MSLRRGRVLRALLISVTVVVVSVLGVLGWFQWQLGRIERFDQPVSRPTPSTSPTSQPTEALPDVLRLLVFSTGSAGLEDGDGDRLRIGTGRARMADGLTDSVMLVSVRPATGRVDVLSLPRDLWLDTRGHRINESYNRYGVWGLVDDVETLTGLRPDHVVALNFAAFADLTDAVGGVNVYFDQPVRDLKAKLDIPVAGCSTLDGPTALAFVRSRHWQVQRNGIWQSDSTSSDWGRIERQQSFLRIITAKLLDWRLPSRIPALIGVAQDNLKIDQSLTLGRIVSLAAALSGSGVDIHASTYPGRGGITDHGASVIYPDLEAGLELVRLGEQQAQNFDTVNPSGTGVSSTITSEKGTAVNNQPSNIPTPSVSTPSAGLSGTGMSTTGSAAVPTPNSVRGFSPSRDGTGGTRFRGC